MREVVEIEVRKSQKRREGGGGRRARELTFERSSEQDLVVLGLPVDWDVSSVQETKIDQGKVESQLFRSFSGPTISPLTREGRREKAKEREVDVHFSEDRVLEESVLGL